MITDDQKLTFVTEVHHITLNKIGKQGRQISSLIINVFMVDTFKQINGSSVNIEIKFCTILAKLTLYKNTSIYSKKDVKS